MAIAAHGRRNDLARRGRVQVDFADPWRQASIACSNFASSMAPLAAMPKI